MSLRQFLIVVEKAKKNYAAYSPDLPGCIATGRTRREVERNMHEAIQIHIEGMLEDGLPIPPATTSAAYLLHNVPSRKRPGSRRSVQHSTRRADRP